MGNLFNSLVTIDTDLNYVPDLAESWEVLENGKVYVFHLRRGVKFHDGAPLTAEDVVASFEHIIFPRPGIISPRQGLFDAVKEVVATGPLTVEFRLKEPNGFLLRAIASGFNVIVRKQTLEEQNYDLRVAAGFDGFANLDTQFFQVHQGGQVAGG